MKLLTTYYDYSWFLPLLFGVCYLDSSAIGSQGFVLVLAFTGKNERNKDK